MFSLGSCLYEMLTRIPPFTATNEMDLLIKVRDAKYRPVSELQPGVPPELEAITDKCLTRSRANRYQTAAEAEGDLRAFLRKFMPNYSRSHLGRFIRKMFATEIERELHMLEEFVMTDDVLRRSRREPDAARRRLRAARSSVPAQADVGLGRRAVDRLLGRLELHDDAEGHARPRRLDVHDANTVILADRGRSAAPKPRAKTQPPPREPFFEDDVHAAPTMILDIGRMRRQQRR